MLGEFLPELAGNPPVHSDHEVSAVEVRLGDPSRRVSGCVDFEQLLQRVDGVLGVRAAAGVESGGRWLNEMPEPLASDEFCHEASASVPRACEEDANSFFYGHGFALGRSAPELLVPRLPSTPR